jgi:Holliday junction resolvase-like predicted endonuclease
MKLNIPVSIIRNENYKLDYNSFIIYLKLLELKEINKGDTLKISSIHIKQSTMVYDNRTLKKCFLTLFENKLIKFPIEKLEIKGHNIIELNKSEENEFLEFDLDIMNLMDNIGVIGVRIICYLLSYEINKNEFVNYGEVKSVETMAKRLMLSKDTVSKYSKLIKQTKYKYLFNRDTGALFYQSNYKIPEKKIKNTKKREKELELQIIKNLNVIEDGMRLIKNQYPVVEGFIDILARDKNDTLCVIELKVVTNEERLIFQCVYYPTQFNEKVRMITIAPYYDYKIKTALNSLNVEKM